MATIKQVLDKHFFSFIDNNGLESLKEKMIETIIKAEYELDDVVDDMVENNQHICADLENDIDLLNQEIEVMEEKLKQENNKYKFFEPESLQDEFKIQWIKDNWDKIPTI